MFPEQTKIHNTKLEFKAQNKRYQNKIKCNVYANSKWFTKEPRNWILNEDALKNVLLVNISIDTD